MTNSKYQDFNENIFKNFKELKKADIFENRKLVGEIISLAQLVEYELKILMGLYKGKI